MTMELREKIARAMAVRHGAGWECLRDEPFSHPDKPTWNKQYWFTLADAILAIPEIRDALAFVKGLPGFSPDTPQARQAIPGPNREA
jgi:hypothetical protein